MTLAAEIRVFEAQSIYVACLAAYNNGILHGAWIGIEADIENTWREIRNIFASSPVPDAEEWAIHDYEGFGDVRLSEYESIERVHELGVFLQEHGKVGALLLDHYCGDIEEAERAFDSYMGCYGSIADYAQELTESTSEVPKHLQYYIDYERMGRDMEMSGDIFILESGFEETHVFLNY